MEAIKRQASRLREQVAKQQQAVLKQLSGRFAIDALALDEPDAECHQQLQMLYKSTREAKHFQRNIMRGLEGLISASSRQMRLVTSKLADACCKYGENENSDAVLARASLHFGNSHHSMEEEREKLLKILGDQVYEPLRTMIMGAPLEDARHLAHCYEKLRQDVESQLQHSELRLSELGSALAALGREATSAMESVAADQQRITFQQLLAMVDAERGYHHNVASILDELRDAMVLERQKSESERQPASTVGGILALAACEEEHEEEEKLQSDDLHENHTNGVIHPFDAQADGELSLSTGDYVVVRQGSENGWLEGECKGKAGWFPAAYAERRDRAPANR
ncbi:unnamed protein product [Spirodela intermedia]|uniref:SH3 domain-containing protein n=1 Tax=Spirodela intermedia TaxID=51605 RepID=A0A7I8JH97_SPIIN|nr:unnamed protein product [Spirodela intermedia]CAA6669508.1 unnamed protein product [Spirodela intermedia]